MNIAIVSSAQDVLIFKKLKTAKGTKFFATTFDAKNRLQNLDFPFGELDINYDKKTVEKINKQTLGLLKFMENNDSIIRSFTINNQNILEFVYNNFYHFLTRMSIGYFGAEQIEK